MIAKFNIRYDFKQLKNILNLTKRKTFGLKLKILQKL